MLTSDSVVVAIFEPDFQRRKKAQRKTQEQRTREQRQVERQEQHQQARERQKERNSDMRRRSWRCSPPTCLKSVVTYGFSLVRSGMVNEHGRPIGHNLQTLPIFKNS